MEDAGAAAGWHPDPTGLHRARYWDGARWTAEVIDRNRAPLTHATTQEYPSPVRPRSTITRNRIEADPDMPSTHVGPDVSDPYALLVMERLAHGDPANTSAEDALANAVQVVQRACERAGFDWRASELTIDGAIDALPGDLAEATLAVLLDAYAAETDDDNTRWIRAKLGEVRSLRRAHRRLQSLIDERFGDDFIAKAVDSGVSTERTEAFIEQFVDAGTPTVAQLRTTHTVNGSGVGPSTM